MGHTQGVVPAVHHDLQQHGLGEVMVLPPQRRCWPSAVHREVADGEARRLVSRRVAPFAATEAGVPHHCPMPPSGHRVGGGIDHRLLPPPADHPPHGEGAPHLRDE
jgi:hypothetical protein